MEKTRNRVLITGITGQDGSYLARDLLADGYEVYGLIRGQWHPKREWLETTAAPGVRLVQGDLLDQMSLIRAVAEVQPDYVYNLGAVSAPALGWNQPTLTAEVTGLGLLKLLEAVKLQAPNARVLQASSVALHGPYGAAKTFAQAIADDYREQGMHVTCAVMTGHHSPRRGREFFARKVTHAVHKISTGEMTSRLVLGPLSRRQDWGWAENFVHAQRIALERLTPGNYTVGTGDPHSNEEWVSVAFVSRNMDWRDHCVFNDALGQPTDVDVLSAKPSPELIAAGWAPHIDFPGLAITMVESESSALS